MLQCKALWLSLLVAAFLPVAWRSNESPQGGTKKPASPAASVPKDEIAAVVNGDRIMLSELIGRLNELGVLPEKREQVAGDMLDGLIDNCLLVQFLSAQKLPYDAKAVDAQIAEVRAEYEKEGVKFREALARIGLTEQKLRASVIAEAQWQNHLKRNVTDKQLAEYFAKYREYFDGTEVRASHILVEVPTDADEKTRAAAKAKMERVRKELAAGLDFTEAAKKYSDCPSKEQGGDVDYFPRRDKMVEPFAKATFALKTGQISNVVETEFGYHIIMATGRKPGTRTKFDDPELRKDLLEAYGEQMKNEIVAKQRQTAQIQIAPGVQRSEQPKAKTATQPTPGKVKK